MLHYIFLAFSFVFVTSLRLEDVDEGSCQGVEFQPVPDRGVDFLNVLRTFRYAVAGSRFPLYYFASGQSHFREMRESELRDHLCLHHKGVDELGQGAFFGFGGRLLANGIITGKTGQTVFNFLLLASNVASSVSLRPSTHTITLTDYESFVFAATCLIVNGSQHKVWLVLSSTPNLSYSTKIRIEQHATSLGFNPENFVFLNLDSCSADDINFASEENLYKT